MWIYLTGAVYLLLSHMALVLPAFEKRPDAFPCFFRGFLVAFQHNFSIIHILWNFVFYFPNKNAFHILIFIVTYWQVFLHTKWITHTSYAKQDQRRCNESNITISRLLYDGKVHNCTGCASAHTRLEFRSDISMCSWPAVARRKVSLTSMCVYRASVFCRSSISRSQFHISCPYICSGWVFRGACVYLADPWGHTFSDNSVFSFLSATVAKDLVSLLLVEEPHQNRPRVGAADRTWSVGHFDVRLANSRSYFLTENSRCGRHWTRSVALELCKHEISSTWSTAADCSVPFCAF